MRSSGPVVARGQFKHRALVSQTYCDVTPEKVFEDAGGATLFCKAYILPYCSLASPNRAISMRPNRLTSPHL